MADGKTIQERLAAMKGSGAAPVNSSDRDLASGAALQMRLSRMKKDTVKVRGQRLAGDKDEAYQKYLDYMEEYQSLRGRQAMQKGAWLKSFEQLQTQTQGGSQQRREGADAYREWLKYKESNPGYRRQQAALKTVQQDQERGKARTAKELSRQIDELETAYDAQLEQMSTQDKWEAGQAADMASMQEERKRLKKQLSEVNKALGVKPKGAIFGDALSALVEGADAQAMSGWNEAGAYIEAGANRAAAWALRDLAKPLPQGKLKSGMLELADRMAVDVDMSGAQAWQEEYERIMQEATAGHSGAAKWVLEQLPSAGAMILDQGLAGYLGAGTSAGMALAGGQSAGSVLKSGTVKQKLAQGVSDAAARLGSAAGSARVSSLALMGVRAGGNAALEAKNNGATDAQALAYGVAAGGLEAFSEKLFGGNPVYDQDAGLVNKLAGKLTSNKTVLKILDSKAFDFASEGLEEIVTEVLDPVAEWAIYNRENTEFADAASIGNAFLGGVFLSALGNVVDAPNQIRQARSDKAMRAVSQALVEQAQALGGENAQAAAQAVQEKLDYGRTPDAADVGSILDAMSRDGAEADVQAAASAAQSAEEPQRSDYETYAQYIDEREKRAKARAEEQRKARQEVYQQENAGNITSEEAERQLDAIDADEGQTEFVLADEEAKAAREGADFLANGTQEQADYEAHSAENERQAAIQSVQQAARKAGYSEQTQAVMLEGYEAERAAGRAEADGYIQGFEAAYQYGQNGMSLAAAQKASQGLTAQTVRAAWTAGKETAGNGRAGGEASYDGGKRDAGVDSGKPGRGVAGGAGQTGAGAQGGRSAQAGLELGNRVRAENVPQQSGKDLGIQDGSAKPSFREVPQRLYTQELTELEAGLKAAGATKVHFIVGSIGRENTRAHVTRYADGLTRGTEVWIQADSSRRTAREIAQHEEFHLRAETEQDFFYKGVMALTENLTDAQIQEMADRYAEAYEGCYDEADKQAIMEEMLADAFAGINRRGAQADRYTQIIRDAVGEPKAGSKKTGETRAPPEKYSISEAGIRNRTQDEITAEYQNAVHGILNGTFNVKGALLVGYTPEIYRKLGMPDLPFVVGSGHVYSIAKTQDEAKTEGRFRKNTNYHGLGERAVADILQAVKNPVMVISAKDVDRNATPLRSTHSVVALVDVGTNGKSLVVPVSITAQNTVDGNVMDVNMISSVYEKNARGLVNEAIAQFNSGENSIFYVTKKAATLAGEGVQFPSILQAAATSSDGIVRKIDSKINMSIKNVTQSQQFKRWFGDWQNKPETASKVVNADGTPKVVYHQTGNDFTIFDVRKNGAGTRDNETPFGIFLKSSSRDIGLNGKKQMALYVNIRNPLYAQGRADLTRQLRELSPEYDAIRQEHAALDKEYKQKFEDAKRNFISFLTEWKKNHPGESSRSLYGTPEFERVFDAEDAVVEEWTSKADVLSVRAKEVLTDALKQAGYDGVILANDAGSWGRSTDAYIALSENQVKSATDNVGTFDRDNPDIRYSVAEDAPQAEGLSLDTISQTSRKILMGQVQKAAKELAWELSAQSETVQRTLEPRLRDMVNEYLADGSIRDETLQTAFNQAYELAKQENRDFAEHYGELRDAVKATEVTLQETDEPYMQNYDRFNPKALKTFKLLDEGGMSISTFYEMLSEEYPELLPPEIDNPAKQIMRVDSVVRRIAKANILNAEAESANPKAFRQKAWEKFTAGVRELTPALRDARQYAEDYRQEEAELARQAEERAQRQAEEDARREEEAARAKPEVLENLSLDTVPKEAKDTLERMRNMAAAEIQRKMDIPYKARQEVLKPQLDGLINEYLRTGSISQESIDRSFERAYEQGREISREFYDQYKEIKDQMRGTRLTLSDADKADFADYNEFWKSALGRLRIANEGGLPVDTAYQSLREAAPELFPAGITHPADQLAKMLKVSRSIEIVERTLDEAAGPRAEEYKRYAKNDFTVTIENMQGALRMARRYAEARQRLKERNEAGRPKTLEDVQALYKELKSQRRTYERAMSKALLTEEDQKILDQLMRGERGVETLEGTENGEAIRRVFEAKFEYSVTAARIAEWKRTIRAQRAGEAESFLKDIDKAKDKALGIQLSRETMTRNNLDVFGEQAGAAINKAYFAPIRKAEAEAKRYKDKMRGRVKELGLSRKVENGNVISEAYAVQLLGEAEDNIRMLQGHPYIKERDGKSLQEWQALVQELWKQNPKLDEAKIRRGVETLRSIYDEMFRDINEGRVRNGYEPINYRSGYFPHFQRENGSGGIKELLAVEASGEDKVSDSLLRRMGEALGMGTKADELPTTIAGRTYQFKPGIRWFGNAQERLGFATAYDALEGFDRYIEGAAGVIYQTDNIQRLRAFANQIRYLSSDEGIREQVDGIRALEDVSEEDKQNRIDKIYESGRYQLGHYIQELDDYTNLLANKKSQMDRGVERQVGRKVYRLAKGLESRVAANMVAINPGSWLTNFGVIAQASAELKSTSILKAMQQTLAAQVQDDGFIDKSAFLTNRQGSEALIQSLGDRVSKTLSVPMELIDMFSASTIVRARCMENLQRGMTEADAIDEADQFAADVMAERSKGGMPTLFESKNPLIKLFTQFQLEVNNTFSYLFKDVPRRKRKEGILRLTMAIFKFVVNSWIFNELYEKLVGRRSQLDPINLITDLVGDVTGTRVNNLLDWGKDGIVTQGEANTAMGTIGNFGQSLAEELPFIGNLAGGGKVPVASSLPSLTNISNAVESDKLTAGQKAAKIGAEIAKPAAYWLPPFGGGQALKLWKGIEAYKKGGSYTADGRLQYPVYTDRRGDKAEALTKTLLFGKSATEGAKAWVEGGFGALSERATKTYEALREAGIDQRDSFALIKKVAATKKTDDASEAENRIRVIQEAEISDEAKALCYYGMIASESEQEKMDAYVQAGMDMGDYVDYREAERKIEGVKDSDGKTISGSKKQQVMELLTDSDFTESQKTMLFEGSNYTAKGFEPWTQNYKTLYKAVSTGKNLRQTLQSLKSAGYEEEQIREAITDAFRQEYVEAGKEERMSLRGYLRNAFVRLGLSEKKALNKIDAWVEEKEDKKK